MDSNAEFSRSWSRGLQLVVQALQPNKPQIFVWLSEFFFFAVSASLFPVR
jgi:hypothetical protein